MYARTIGCANTLAGANTQTQSLNIEGCICNVGHSRVFCINNFCEHHPPPFPQAQEAQDDLLKTKEELHMVMTAPPPPPPPPMFVEVPMFVDNHEVMTMAEEQNDHDSEENNSTYSADLQNEGFNDHRLEEERLTEAEKNERVQKQLMVRERSSQRAV